MKLFKTIVVLLAMTSLLSCAQKPKKPQVTFLELGSVRCIPCQKMQGVIKQIEAKYPQDQVKTIFYDVWTDEGAKSAENYEFDAIPTQIFLDADGKEFARHEGFFPFEDLDKIIQQKL